jgi:hypothetical protein
MSEKLYLNSSKAKAKIRYKSRGRMQIIVKLSDDEAQAFKNWSSQVKPPQLDQDSFLKQIFFNGIASINQQISQMAQESLKDPAMREQLKNAGVDIEKLEQEMMAAQGGPSEPLENPVTEITDPAAPVEVPSDTPETTK